MSETQVSVNSDAKKQLDIENRAKSGANWFFWIAGLSSANSILLMSGANVSFPVGLGVTQLIDRLALDMGMGAQAISRILIAATAAAFVLVGVMARKNLPWAFISGLALYAGDGLIFFLVRDWLSIAFHVWAFIAILSGLRATNQIRESLPTASTVATSPLPVSGFQRHTQVK